MKLPCNYHVNFNVGYGCQVRNFQIPNDVDFEFIGKHETRKSDFDVRVIAFSNCRVTKIPQGLTRIYPNLVSLIITGSNLKHICRNDLLEYKNFKEFRLGLNQIEFLPGDLLEDCKKLEAITFENNILRTVEPNILDGLENLKYVNLNGTHAHYGEVYSEVPLKCGDPKLEEIKTKLYEEFLRIDPQNVKNFCSNLVSKVKTLKASNNEDLGKEIVKLKAENESLRRQNEEIDIFNQVLIQQVQDYQNSEATLKTDIENYKISEQRHIQQLEKLKFDLKNAQKCQKFSSDFKNFLQADELLKDFWINIDDRQFHVHKILLAARSPTLAEILRNNPDASHLNLVDISVNIFEDILKFLYTDEYPINSNFIQLFAAAGQLKIEELMDYAAQKMLERIKSENALEVLSLGNKYGCYELKLKAFNEIRKKYSGIEFKDEWIDEDGKIEKIIVFFKKMERDFAMLMD